MEPNIKSPFEDLKNVFLKGKAIISKNLFSRKELTNWLMICNSTIGKLYPTETPFKKELRNLLRPPSEKFDKEVFLKVFNIISKIYRTLNDIQSYQIIENNSGVIQKKSVFIIHGHDQLNLLKLKNMVQDDFGLNPVVMQYAPGLNRYLLQKFEQEAEKCSFSIALFTKDDLVTNKNKESYYQARPNVIFEFGWLLSSLGKEKLLIVLENGVKLHSDYDGISRVQFSDDISYAFKLIQQELKGLGVI